MCHLITGSISIRHGRTWHYRHIFLQDTDDGMCWAHYRDFLSRRHTNSHFLTLLTCINVRVKNVKHLSRSTVSYGEEAENRWVLGLVVNDRRHFGDVTCDDRLFQGLVWVWHDSSRLWLRNVQISYLCWGVFLYSLHTSVIFVMNFSLSFSLSLTNSLFFWLSAIFVIVAVNVNHTGIVTCKQAQNIQDATWRCTWRY